MKRIIGFLVLGQVLAILYAIMPLLTIAPHEYFARFWEIIAICEILAGCTIGFTFIIAVAIDWAFND